MRDEPVNEGLRTQTQLQSWQSHHLPLEGKATADELEAKVLELERMTGARA
jgi:hypothetical protein